MLSGWDPDTGAWVVADTVDAIEGLLRSIELNSGLATALTSDSEVSDARNAYGTLDHDQANRRLGELGVRGRETADPLGRIS